jgi:RHS repeat-associated protein
MPGDLMPSTAYTYATELAVDEARKAGASAVEFSKPVRLWVDNFLEMPIGMPVPQGRFDHALGRWVPLPDGVVFKVLRVADGRAVLSLDTAGEQEASEADLARHGIEAGELEQLARVVKAGQSLWRVQMTHFSPYDLNWPPTPPPDAQPPTTPPDFDPPPPDSPCIVEGSVIGCEPQTLGERVGVVGTPYSLVYQSERTAGRGRALKIPLVPTRLAEAGPLKAIELEVHIAGQRHVKRFEPSEGLSYLFEWDGTDAFGKPVARREQVRVVITYEYDGCYAWPAKGGTSFERGVDPAMMAGSGEAQVCPAALRAPARVSRDFYGWMGAWQAKPRMAMGGWAFDAHHAYDSKERRIYMGDGSERAATLKEWDKLSLAPKGWPTLPGRESAEVEQFTPISIAAGANGEVFILGQVQDDDAFFILKRQADGEVVYVAGVEWSLENLFECLIDQSCPPTLGAVRDVPLFTQIMRRAPDGTIYIADLNSCIAKLVGDRWVAVAGQCGRLGSELTEGTLREGMPAIGAPILAAGDLAISPSGQVFFTQDSSIWKIDAQGILWRVAGLSPEEPLPPPQPLIEQEGRAAREVYIEYIRSLAVDGAGTVYFTQENERRIWSVPSSGQLRLAAGSGEDEAEEEGDALAVGVDYGYGLQTTRDGQLMWMSVRNGAAGIGFGTLIRLLNRYGETSVIAGALLAADADTEEAIELSLNGFPKPARGTILFYGIAMSVDERGDPWVIQLDGRDTEGNVEGPALYHLRSTLPGESIGEMTIPSRGGEVLYVFDYHGKHIKTRDAVWGHDLVKFGYDARGMLESIEDEDGLKTMIERDAQGAPAAIVGPYGHRTTLEVDASGYLSKITNPNDESIRATYTPEGLLTSFSSPSGATSRMEYDASGFLVKDADAEQGFKTLTRQEDGTVEVETAEGRKKRFGWKMGQIGEWSRLVAELGAGTQTSSEHRADGTIGAVDALGTRHESQTAPDPRWGRLAPYVSSAKQTLASGRVFAQRATLGAELEDPNDRMSWKVLRSLSWVGERGSSERGPWRSELERDSGRVETTTPLGRKSFAVLDARGRVVEQGAPGVTPTRYEYDAQGRVVKTTQGARTLTLRYGADGLVEQVEDGLGRTTTITRDAVGRPTKADGPPTGRAWETSYDADGRRTSLVPPGRPAHTWEYSIVGRLMASVLPQVAGMMARISNRYDKDGLPLEVTREDGTTQRAEYDAAGRLVRSISALGSWSFLYNATSGQIERVEQEGNGAVALEWEGPLLRGVEWSGAVSGRLDIDYGDIGQLSALRLDQGPSIAFEHDADGLPTRVGELELGWADELTRLDTLRAIGCERTLTYDPDGMPQGIDESCDGAPRWSETLEYDALARISAVDERILTASARRTFTYDDAGRLEAVRRNNAIVATYTYDAHDNRLSRTPASGPAELGEYDDQDKLVSYSGRDYTHDARGRVTGWSQSAQTTSLEWDDDDRLASLTLPNGQKLAYTFDASGRRASLSLDGTPQHKLLFNGLQLIALQDPSGALTQRYVYATHSHVPDLILHQSEWYRVIKDVRGSVRLVVHATDGTVAQRLDYDEFGRVTADSSPGFQPFGFAGGLYDHYSGLVLFGYRVYDPFTGRFLTRDPLWHGGGHSNLYLYVANDPVNFVDPDGLFLQFLFEAYLVSGMAAVATSPGTPINNIAGKVWGAPTSAIGLLIGSVGNLVNVFAGGEVTIDWDKDSIIFYDNPFQKAFGTTTTFGNVICYKHKETDVKNKFQGTTAHENEHVKQSAILGPAYLPLHIGAGLNSSYHNSSSQDPWHADNWLEEGPEEKPRNPWPRWLR